jgi:hypothetical protein
MTPAHPVDVADIAREAAILVGRAEAMGVKLRITQAPNTPLAMGNTRPVIETWAARGGVPAPDSRGRFASTP